MRSVRRTISPSRGVVGDGRIVDLLLRLADGVHVLADRRDDLVQPVDVHARLGREHAGQARGVGEQVEHIDVLAQGRRRTPGSRWRTLVVRARSPSSMARNTSTLVIALVTEKIENTLSSARGLVLASSAWPKACSTPHLAAARHLDHLRPGICPCDVLVDHRLQVVQPSLIPAVRCAHGRLLAFVSVCRTPARAVSATLPSPRARKSSPRRRFRPRRRPRRRR